MKPFKYKVPRRHAAAYIPKIRLKKEKEFLTGMVDGQKASAPEEYLAGAARRYGKFHFRLAVNGFRGQSGWKELDFLFNVSGRWVAVEVDETSFIHRGEVTGIDPDDLIRLEGLRKLGVDVSEIVHVDAEKLKDKVSAAKTARELFV